MAHTDKTQFLEIQRKSAFIFQQYGSSAHVEKLAQDWMSNNTAITSVFNVEEVGLNPSQGFGKNTDNLKKILQFMRPAAIAFNQYNHNELRTRFWACAKAEAEPHRPNISNVLWD